MERHPPSDLPMHTDLGHEPNKVSAPVVFWTIVGLLVVFSAASLGLLFWSERLDAEAAQRIRPDRQLASPPPAPSITEDLPRQLAQLRAEKRALLSSYGWADEERTRATIPIDRAMQHVAEQGLEAASRMVQQGLPEEPSEAQPSVDRAPTEELEVK